MTASVFVLNGSGFGQTAQKVVGSFVLTQELIDDLRASCNGAPNQLACMRNRLIDLGATEEEATAAVGDILAGVVDIATPRVDLVKAKEAGIIDVEKQSDVPMWAWVAGGVALLGIGYFLLKR